MAKVANKLLKNTCRVCGKYASFKKSYKIFDKTNKKLLGNIETLTGLRVSERRVCSANFKGIKFDVLL